MIKFIKFASVPVYNQDRAFEFYVGKLGFQIVEAQPRGETLRWLEMTIPGARTRLLFVNRSDERPSSVPSLVLIADDVSATHSDLVSKGVRFLQAPEAAHWEPGATFALFNDTEGNLIVLADA